MTLAELVLDRMKEGAKLIAIADPLPGTRENGTYSEITRLLIVMTFGAEIPLPLRLITEMGPHLVEDKCEEDCRFVYTVREH